MNLFSAVSPDDIRTAQILTSVAMAGFIGSGLVPALRPYGTRIRLALLLLYLLACGVLAAKVLLQ